MNAGNAKDSANRLSAAPVTPKGIKTRIAILDAARTVLARDGYVAMRMGDVAVEAGVSMGGLYRYFENKENLFANLIADIHETLLEASRATEVDFKSDPYGALLESNRGYLECYYNNRDIMRALFEAITVDERDRDIWWEMRNHHIDRFLHTLEEHHGITEVDGVDSRTLAEAMASMVEQSAYCWYAQEALNSKPIPLDTAAKTVTMIWYSVFFGDKA